MSLGDDLIERWWREHAEHIYRYAARRLGATRAEDICAQTFEIAWRRRDQFDRRLAARPWLFGIASNLIRRELRSEERGLRAYARTGVDPVQAEEIDRLVERVDAAVEWPAIAAALGDLRSEDREVLWLAVVGGLNYAELAECLEVPLGTVRSRLSRARARLQRAVPSTHGTDPGGSA